jgi:hypothetical protein
LQGTASLILQFYLLDRKLNKTTRLLPTKDSTAFSTPRSRPTLSQIIFRRQKLRESRNLYLYDLRQALLQS